MRNAIKRKMPSNVLLQDILLRKLGSPRRTRTQRDLKSLFMVSQQVVGSDGNLTLYATIGLNQ